MRTSHASAGGSRVGPRHGQGCRGARVGPAMRAAGGMRVNRGRPGAWPSSVSSRFRLTAPLTQVCSSGGAQPRPPSTLPACAGTQGAVGACVFATALHSPAFAGLFSAAGSAAHAHGPLCASACKVIGPPAARMAGPPSRAPRHPCPWRYRFGFVRLRGLCAPSAAETAAAAVAVPGSAVTNPGPQTAGDGPQAVPESSYAVVRARVAT